MVPFLFRLNRRYSSSTVENESIHLNENFTEASKVNIQVELEELKANNNLNEENLKALLGQCRKEHDFETALKALKMAKEANIELSSEIYSQVLGSGLYNLKFFEIRELFGESNIPPEKDSDRTHTKNFNQLKILLDEIHNKGYEIQMWIYESLVTRMHGAGQAGVIVNLILGLEKKGIIPTISMYNRALHIFPRKGLTDRAESLFNKLVMKGLANYQTYTTWMASLVLMERFNEVEQVFRTISKLFSPDLIAFNILINSRLKAENFNGALEVFDKLRLGEIEGIKPDGYTISTFLDHMLATGNVQNTQRLFPYLSQLGFPKSSQDYGLLLRFFARYDDSQFKPLLKSFIVEKKELQDLTFYNALLRILTDSQVLAEVKKELGIVVSEGFDMGFKSALLDTIPSAPLATRAIVYLMERGNVKPDDFTFETIMRQLVNRHEYETADNLYSYYKGISNHNPTYTLKNLRLTALLSLRKGEESRKHLEEMRITRAPVYPRNLELCQEMNIQLPQGIPSLNGGKFTKSKQPQVAEFI
jgi:pentatricopeptide repeat protein